jgi:hypothetical protein
MIQRSVRNKNAATRRNFFVKAGTALALPLAAGAATTDLVTREDPPLGTLDPVKSIRRLQQALAREINDATGLTSELFAGGKVPAELAGVTRLLPADFGEHDAVEIATDGRTARATVHCAVETQVPIAAEGTLIEMARAQGEGFVRTTACRVLDMVCVRAGETWKIKAFAMHEA